MRFIIKYGGECTKNLTPQTGLNQNHLESRLPGTGNQKKMIARSPKGMLTLWPWIPWLSRHSTEAICIFAKICFDFSLENYQNVLSSGNRKSDQLLASWLAREIIQFKDRELVQMTLVFGFPLEMAWIGPQRGQRLSDCTVECLAGTWEDVYFLRRPPWIFPAHHSVNMRVHCLLSLKTGSLNSSQTPISGKKKMKWNQIK